MGILKTIKILLSRQAEKPQQKIWFVMGLSGAGKTYFSEYLAKTKRLLHIDVDGRGIISCGLEAGWNKFCGNGSPRLLISQIVRKYSRAGAAGAVLSFPSMCFINADKMKKIKDAVRVVYLFGPQKSCFESFLKRDAVDQRVRKSVAKDKHWQYYNKDMLSFLARPLSGGFAVSAFHDDGERKSPKEILREIERREKESRKVICK